MNGNKSPTGFHKVGPWDVWEGEITNPTLTPCSASPANSRSDASGASPECPGCHGAGWYTFRVPAGHPQFGKLQRCECLDGQPTPKQVAQLAQLRQDLGDLAEKRLDRFNPLRWVDPAFADPNDQRQALEDALQTCQAYAARPNGWIYLYGSYGSGKSHLAAGIVTTVAETGWTGAYASVPRLLDYVKAGYKDYTASDRLAALVAADILVLDDLGTEAMTASNRQIVFDLLNERDESRRNRPTVITSNVHYNDPAFDGRVSDRIAGMVGAADERLVVLPVSSYRRRKVR